MFPSLILRKMQKKNNSKGIRTETMGAARHGLYRHLWAVSARSNRRHALIRLWVTPSTTGSIEIEWGGDENITIKHGCGGCDCGCRRSWPLPPPLGCPRPFQSTAHIDRVMCDAIYDQLHQNRVGGVTKNRQGRCRERPRSCQSASKRRGD